MDKEARASTERTGTGHRAVLRKGREVFWRCEHRHNTRGNNQCSAFDRWAPAGPGEPERYAAINCALDELNRRCRIPEAA